MGGAVESVYTESVPAHLRYATKAVDRGLGKFDENGSRGSSQISSLHACVLGDRTLSVDRPSKQGWHRVHRVLGLDLQQILFLAARSEHYINSFN